MKERQSIHERMKQRLGTNVETVDQPEVRQIGDKFYKINRDSQGNGIIDPQDPSGRSFMYVPASMAEYEQSLRSNEVPVNSIEACENKLQEIKAAEDGANVLLSQISAERAAVEQELALKQEEARLEAEAERQRLEAEARAAEDQRRAAALDRFRARNSAQPQFAPAIGVDANSEADKAAVANSSRFGMLKTTKAKVAMTSVALGAAYMGLDGAKLNPFTSADAATDASSAEIAQGAEISAAAFDVDNCFADDGTGKPLFSGDIAFMDWVNWPIEKADKSIIEAGLPNDNPEYSPIGKENQEARKPVITVETAVDYAACVPEADAASFLSVDTDNKVITVDLSKATPQFALPKESTQYGVEQFELTEVDDAIVTDEAKEVAIAATQDEAVLASLVDMAKAKAAGVIAKADGEYAEEMKTVTDSFEAEITEEINQQAVAFYEASGQPAETFEVKIEGELKTTALEYKGNAPEATDKVSLAGEALKVTQFNPITK